MKNNSKQRLHGAIRKRRKVPKRLLCNLPTDILSCIVSKLPINDAMRTSVLSRKWKYVWCCHPNLTFNSATMRKRYFKSSTGYGYEILSDQEFIMRVDMVLHQHSGVGVQHMKFQFRLNNKHADDVDRWVNFAIASKTKELIIDLSGGAKSSLSRDILCGIHRVREELYNLPSQLFTATNGSYLQRLELTSVSLKLPADFTGFMNLKNVILVDVSITDEDVQCMLLRCNLLEAFEISYCRAVTSIRVRYPLNQLKHLVLDKCPLLQVVQLNCCPTMLKYTGNMVPLIFASTSRLKNVQIEFLTSQSALCYMITGFPRTLLSLETLTLRCGQDKRTIVPKSSFKFTHLRHLRLELVLHAEKDVLEYAYLLEVAPFLEKLELLMWVSCEHPPYREEDGELRILPRPEHAHLKFVRFSGFFGHKDQVELALHILRSSVILEKMEITPKVEITNCDESMDRSYERNVYVEGHEVATEFVCRADDRNVVDAVRASFSWGPPLGYVLGRAVRLGTPQQRVRLSRYQKGCRRSGLKPGRSG